jgi:hypothetical protein
VVQHDVGDGQEDQQGELSGAGPALGAVGGVEPNWGFHPLVVRCCFRCQSRRRNLSAQSLNDMPRRDGPGTSEHDMEHLAALVVAGLRVRVAIDDLQCTHPKTSSLCLSPPGSPPSAYPPTSGRAILGRKKHERRVAR